MECAYYFASLNGIAVKRLIERYFDWVNGISVPS